MGHTTNLYFSILVKHETKWNHEYLRSDTWTSSRIKLWAKSFRPWSIKYLNQPLEGKINSEIAKTRPKMAVMMIKYMIMMIMMNSSCRFQHRPEDWLEDWTVSLPRFHLTANICDSTAQARYAHDFCSGPNKPCSWALRSVRNDALHANPFATTGRKLRKLKSRRIEEYPRIVLNENLQLSLNTLFNPFHMFHPKSFTTATLQVALELLSEHIAPWTWANDAKSQAWFFLFNQYAWSWMEQVNSCILWHIQNIKIWLYCYDILFIL